MHRNMVCVKGQYENINHTYTKFCCYGKQRSGIISGYLIDVKGRFKVFAYKKKSPK